MSRKLEYDGRPELNRSRRLEEVPVERALEYAPAPDETDPIQDATDTLFTKIGRTYLKGKKLEEGLSKMDPAQFIPISDAATIVSRAAERLDAERSQGGTIVPFTLYQRCVKILADKQWKIRRVYERVALPDDGETSFSYYTREYSHDGDDLGNLLSSFLTGDAVAGAILTAFAVSPSSNLEWLGLSAEESAAKSIHSIKIPIGIAILIELGIKAARIVELLKSVNADSPDIEQIANDLENPNLRKDVLEKAGLEPEKFYKAQQGEDAQTVLEYCNNYIANHRPDGPITYDHWVAFGNVVARNNLLRGAFDTATSYSKTFATAFDRDKPIFVTGGTAVDNYAREFPQVRISSQIGSHYNELERESSTAYDQILNSFMYQVTDSDMCCIVEIYGSMDTKALRLISQMLKILSVDLQADVALLQDSFLKLLVNAASAATYSIISRLDKISGDIAIRIFEVVEDINRELGYELEHCPGLNDIGISLSLSIDAIRRKIELMLLDVLQYVEQLGTPQSAVWHVPAERRHLLTLAKIFDVLSSKLEAAKVCERDDDQPYTVQEIVGEAKDQAAHEIIHTLLDKSPPSIQISDEDIKKYFPGLRPSKSPTFGFTYGPKTIFPDKIGQRDETLNNCSAATARERQGHVEETVARAMTARFSKQDG
jgi:hypothetical protein